MIYAVIDTNILVSALWTRNSDAATCQIMGMIADGVITPLHNADIIAEYQEVLNRDKFRFPKDIVSKLVATIKIFGIDSFRIPYNSPMPDESDRVFYEVALSKDDAYLVTGNSKHFPATPIVVTPAEMLEIIRQENKDSH